MITYKNPIIPGFHPDPSVCRDGNDFYLVTSSFEYFPGIPLFHSTDLIHWTHIGHVLTRKSQLDLSGCSPSGGIWAPTIRKHDGRFYVSTTNFSHGGNFYVWTDDIRSEWSDPVWVDQGGIDPSIFFDGGKAYFTSTFDLPETQGIGQCVIDIETGKKLSETVDIWDGSGGKYTEGPHMFKKDGYYYLIAAEGGTEYGHMVTIARADNPWGPFESYKKNPILTHRDTKLHQFQAIGHADLIQDTDDRWWILFHGIRTTQYMLHHIGRETMLAPVEWTDDGWPVVNNGEMILPEMSVDRSPCIVPNWDKPNILLDINYLRNPYEENYDLSQFPSYAILKGSPVTLNECDSPSFFGKRQEHFAFEYKTTVEAIHLGNSAKAGITVFHTNEHHYDLFITEENNVSYVILRKHVGDMETENKIMLPDGGKTVLFKVIADKYKYTFSIERNGSIYTVGDGRTQLLSTECMPMTFTGCYVGNFAEGDTVVQFLDTSYIGLD